MTGWGYELVKHDFSTFDILGRWGMTMGAELTSEGWHLPTAARPRRKSCRNSIAPFARAWAMPF